MDFFAMSPRQSGRNSRRVFTNAAAASVVGIIILAVVLTVSGRLGHSPEKNAPGRTSPPTASITPSDLQAMKSYGDDVDLASVSGRHPRINVNAAFSTAAAKLGFLSGADAVSTDLVYLSDAKFGVNKSDPSSGATPTFVPDIHHRLVWLFVFDNVRGAGSGGPFQSPQPSQTDDAPARMWFAVDADSGDFLVGRTIQN